MSHLAEVVTLYETNSRSMPEMLRKLADSIESEDAAQHDMTTSIACIQLKESGDIEIYGWGDLDDKYKCVGVLAAAMKRITP
jgi:hypothetical protein